MKTVDVEQIRNLKNRDHFKNEFEHLVDLGEITIREEKNGTKRTKKD